MEKEIARISPPSLAKAFTTFVGQLRASRAHEMDTVPGSRQNSGDWCWDDMIFYGTSTPSRPVFLHRHLKLSSWKQEMEASIPRLHLHKTKHQLPCLCFATMFFGRFCRSPGVRLILLPASWSFPLNFLRLISHQTGLSLSVKAQLVTLGSQHPKGIHYRIGVTLAFMEMYALKQTTGFGK